MQLEIAPDQASLLVAGLENLYLNPQVNPNLKDRIGPVRQLLTSSLQAEKAAIKEGPQIDSGGN